MAEPPMDGPPGDRAARPLDVATAGQVPPLRDARGRREPVAAVVAVAAGGALGLLATARVWSTVTISRLAPLGPLRHDVSGRTLAPGVTGLAVVALAGVLAVLATRGVARRIVGVVLVLAGAGMVRWSVAGLSAVSDARARQIVLDARAGVSLGTASTTDVAVHPTWVVPAALAGVLVIAGGAVTAVRGGRWQGMSARYDAPAGAPATSARSAADPGAGEVVRARADLALWQQLDRGEDPTATEPAGPGQTAPAGPGHSAPPAPSPPP